MSDTPQQDWKSIEGWFDWHDAYQEVVKHFPGGTLVEVGCYLGRSLCSLGRLVKDSGKPFRVVGVDTCLGSGAELHGDQHAGAVAAGGGTFAGTLHQNLIACGVADVVSLLVADSRRAADLFADRSLAFVFLDAAHDYESVKADIAAWLPKVMPGGYLAGDDYERPGYPVVWPGVVRAVNETLPGAEPWSWDAWRYRVKG